MIEAHFEMLARYNQWANRLLYDAASELSDEDYRRDRGAFFGSIHGTLNHILVADRLWLHRLTEAPVASAPKQLDEILHDSLAELRQAREAEDQRIIDLIATYDQEMLYVDVTYRTVRGETFRQPLWHILDHLFNHQTHHRGHVHAMLSQAGMTAPELDLIYFLREGHAFGGTKLVTG